MGVEGIVTSHTIPKAFSTADFIFALKNFILPHVGRFAMVEPHSVVVMDNAQIHDCDEGIRMIREKQEALSYFFCELNYVTKRNLLADQQKVEVRFFSSDFQM